jgi:hypothetical protein
MCEFYYTLKKNNKLGFVPTRKSCCLFRCLYNINQPAHIAAVFLGVSKMTNTTQKQDVHGAVRIGGGTKLHPAVIDAHYGLTIRCSCPGTQQGAAYHKARFFQGVQGNCKS